jgi:transposase
MQPPESEPFITPAELFSALYDIERDAAELNVDERYRLRQSWSKPVCDALHEWLIAQRKLVSEGSGIANASRVGK